MPTSPFSRAQQGDSTPEGSSEGSRKKRGSKPTSKARAKRQRTKDRYAHAREDAQLEGLIPTTPEEALQPERVPPSVQGAQPMSELVAQAIRRGWAVDEGMKPHLVDEMVQIVLDGEMPAKAKIAAFNALRMGDQAQHERDNPKDAKDGNPTAININVVTVDSAPQPVEVETREIEVKVVGDDGK